MFAARDYCVSALVVLTHYLLSR